MLACWAVTRIVSCLTMLVHVSKLGTDVSLGNLSAVQLLAKSQVRQSLLKYLKLDNGCIIHASRADVSFNETDINLHGYVLN